MAYFVGTNFCIVIANQGSFDPVSSPSTELVGFCIVMDFTTSCHLSRSHTSFITSPFICILLCTCFSTFVLVIPFLCDPAIQNAEPSIISSQLYHRILLAFAILSKDSSRPSIDINSSEFLLSTSFMPHIPLIIALSILLKIAVSFSCKHHVSLPYSIADLTQLY